MKPRQHIVYKGLTLAGVLLAAAFLLWQLPLFRLEQVKFNGLRTLGEDQLLQAAQVKCCQDN